MLTPTQVGLLILIDHGCRLSDINARLRYQESELNALFTNLGLATKSDDRDPFLRPTELGARVRREIVRH